MEKHFRLVISCPDTWGIVAAVSAFITERNGWLLEANYHSDQEAGQFYMRHDIKADAMIGTLDAFKTAFEPLAKKFQMEWFIYDATKPKRVAIMATKASHCLVDLLHRWQSKDLFCDVVVVISNHDALKIHVDWLGIDYHHVPMTKTNKTEANDKITQLLDDYDVDLVVLARYMQIIPESLCTKYQHRMINIHHSFLPSFSGANPYQKAYERGVKLIGATSHYVTADLDEGPIIEQDVKRVSHRDTKDDMVRLGKDVEVQVLSRGVTYHLEDRVIAHNNKTIILT